MSLCSAVKFFGFDSHKLYLIVISYFSTQVPREKKKLLKGAMIFRKEDESIKDNNSTVNTEPDTSKICQQNEGKKNFKKRSNFNAFLLF